MDDTRNSTHPEHIYALPNGTFLHEYEIRSVLGHGGFGITYLAMDTLLNEHVAIKEYLPGYLAARFSDKTIGPKSESDREAFTKGVEAFLKEARTIARFRHQNVVQVRRYFELNGTGYIVLNRENGEPLDKILKAGPLPQEKLRPILFGALAGLETVHQAGVLHRDIKPSNIIIRPDGTPVLIDFGAAREFEMRQHSMTTIMSPGYAPPEQYGEGGVQGFWTDFYALGATVYQCVTGEKPPDSLYRMQLARANKDPLVPAEKAAAGQYDGSLLRLIDWMLRLNESERPQTLAEIRQHLEAPRVQKLKLKRSKPRSNRTAIVAALISVILLLAGGAYVWNHFASERRITLSAKQQELAASLKAAGYSRSKLASFETECGSDCPADLSAELAARMSALSTETKKYDYAKSDIERLENYQSTCRACEFSADAGTQLDKLYAEALDKAAFDRLKLRQFIATCRASCVDHYAEAARKRLDLLDAELVQYQKALGDADRLTAYLQSCSLCADRKSAEDQLLSLNEQRPKDDSSLRPSDEEAEYAKALKQDTIEGYQALLRTYPDHPKRGTVLALIKSKQEEAFQNTRHRQTDAITDPNLLNEIRDRLFEQNLDPGAPGSQEMGGEIRKYAEKAGLPPTDQPTSGLLDSLRKAPSLAPWATIAFAKGPRKWGMAWNLPTRREAIVEAQKRCGSDECGAIVSFFGSRCGAFAISSQGWGMTWRNDEQLARQSSLEICEKRGQTCHIIGTVCADGSNRFP